jgi:uncharacterized membrane protein
MATLASEAAPPRKAVKPIAPDRYEKVLSVGAMLLLAAVTIALFKGRADFDRVPLPVWPHLLTIVVAVALTPVMLLRRRGDDRHRVLGYVWIAAMLATAASSFFLRDINHGGFSWIHLLSAWTLIQVPLLWWRARQHDVAAHRAGVRGIVTGALLIAGFFTFPFDRLLGHWLFG